MLFTGDGFFLRRHRLLIEAVARRGYDVASLAQDERPTGGRARYALAAATFAARAVAARGAGSARERLDPRVLKTAFDRSPDAFAFKSRELAATIARREHRPTGIVHVFGLSSPCFAPVDIPYAHYLDYTYALAERANLLNAIGPRDRRRFVERERAAYAGARRIFTMSCLVRDSIVDDYGIAPDRVDVVGAGPNIAGTGTVAKVFGSRRLLFNASEFERKGGPLVLEAFARVREVDSQAALVVVGAPLPPAYAGRPGVEERGRVDAETMHALYATSRLVLAPATNDPFPGVALEAMAHGTPAIVRDRDGMPEIVTDGVDGIVLPEAEATPAGLARAIESVSDADERRFSTNAVETIARRLSWDVVAEKMESFLATLDRG